MSLGRDVLMFTFGLCAGIIVLCGFIVWFMHRLKGSLEGALNTDEFHDVMTGALADVRADELVNQLAVSKDAAEGWGKQPPPPPPRERARPPAAAGADAEPPSSAGETATVAAK